MIMKTFTIRAKPPYNFDLQWKFYSSEKPQPEIYKDGIWRRAFYIEDKLIPVAVSFIGTVDEPNLKVDVFTEINDKEEKHIYRKITDIFRLENDLTELYDFMDTDNVLSKIKKELYGLRPPGMGASIFEGAIKAIIQQQISLQVAYVMTGSLVKRFGNKTKINDVHYYDFPSPEVLANADETELKKCKLSHQKVRYIKEFASEIINGYDLEKIREIDNERAINELMKFKGIGRWSAELILAATLGRMDIGVPDDLGARKAVSYFYFNGKLQSGEKVREFMNRWGKFKGWMVYYLICAMEHKKQRKKKFK